MSEAVTVKSFGEGRPWSSPDGKINLTFFETVFSRAGTDFTANWGKKSGEPKVGETVEGEFFEKNGEQRFRIASQGGGGGGSATRPVHRSYEVESQRDPERSARILRQHSQDMALRCYELLGVKDVDLNQIFATADQFDGDVIAVGEKAAQGAGSVGGTPSSPSSAPREASPAPAQALELEKLLEGAGFTPAQTTVVGRYIEDRFDPSQRASAEASLKDPERVQWAVQKLTEGAEHWSGEPLPVTTPEDDDIPF